MQSFYFWVLLPFIPEIHLSSPLIAVVLCFVLNCFCGMDALKKAGKAGDVSEDEQKIAEEEVQKNTDTYIAKIDKEIEAKTKEIMTV